MDAIKQQIASITSRNAHYREVITLIETDPLRVCECVVRFDIAIDYLHALIHKGEREIERLNAALAS